MMRGATTKTPTKSVSKSAVADRVVPFRTSHSRNGQVGRARTAAHASAGKKGRRIQTAATTNTVVRMMRPNECRDEDCCISAFLSVGRAAIKDGQRAEAPRFYRPPFADATGQTPGAVLAWRRANARERRRLSYSSSGAEQY